MKTEFEKKLKEQSFSYQCHTDGVYFLSQNNDTNSILNVQLILSEPVDEVIHGSRNNNETQAIGYFKLRLPARNNPPKFLILAFQNTSKHCVEFIIIPPQELKKRLVESNRISVVNNKVALLFWLMSDGCIYDCTNISVEGEWYYLSKGLNGRMADGTEWDYADYLNNWDRLKMI